MGAGRWSDDGGLGWSRLLSGSGIGPGLGRRGRRRRVDSRQFTNGWNRFAFPHLRAISPGTPPDHPTILNAPDAIRQDLQDRGASPEITTIKQPHSTVSCEPTGRSDADHEALGGSMPLVALSCSPASASGSVCPQGLASFPLPRTKMIQLFLRELNQDRAGLV
jgi:hypothetical protein